MIDAEGAFIDLSIVDDGDDALTAETEVSDEIPEHTFFLNQGELDAGVPIVGGVILDHRGFAPAIDGGILSYSEYADADFKVEGYELIGIEVTIMPADESTNVPPACLTIGRLLKRTIFVPLSSKNPCIVRPLTIFSIVKWT